MQRELFNIFLLPRNIPSVSKGGKYQSEMTTLDIINILMKLPVLQKNKVYGKRRSNSGSFFLRVQTKEAKN